MNGKVNLYIAGREIPGRVNGESRVAEVETKSGRKIMAFFVSVISLRGTNPANGPVTEYLTTTPENERFLTSRTTNVVGLDVDENGALLSLADLEAKRAQDIMARQTANAAAAAPLSVDLEEIIGDA